MLTEREIANRLQGATERGQFAGWRRMYTGRLTSTGVTLDGAAAGKAWVRSEEDSREETQVWGYASRINLPVYVGPNISGELEIKAVDQHAAAFVAGAGAEASILPPITPDNNSSILIGGRQFKPGRMRLSALGGLYVYVEPFHYPGGFWPGGDFALTPPGTASQQAWCGVAMNPADDTLYQFTGADYALPYLLTEVELGELAVNEGYIPVGAIVLQNGQTVITGGEQIADWRYHIAQAGGNITGFVATAPASDTRNTIQPAADHPALILKNNASQTDNPFQTQTSAGAVNVAITPVGGLVVNEQGADADTRIEGDTDANLLFVDASTDRVGIGTNAPAQLLDVDGTAIIQTLMTDGSTELTIATGAITVTQTFHRIDTEADAASDNLDTINGGTDGQFLVIRAENGGREVVVTTAGNITTGDGNNVSLDEVYKFLLLIYDGNRSKWNVVGGGGSGSGGSGSGTYYQTIRDAGTPMTQRGKLNLIEGADITLTIADDAGNDETEVTIAYSGAGGSGTNSYSLCQGRLTLTSGTPVTTSDVTAATTIYFAPYKGNQIGLYNGSAWEVKTFSEISLSLSGYTASTPYDIWVYNNSGTVTLDSTIWTNDTTRATALALQDGVYVKTGATTRRYVGTIRITGTTGQTEDSVTKRFVWNYYNRVLRELTKTLTGGSYNSATWRQGQANTSNQVELVQGVAEDVSRFLVALQHQLDAGEYAYVGIGIDSTTTNSAQHHIETYAASSGGNYYSSAIYRTVLAVGYHYIAWLESVGSGTVTSARATLMGESFA
jgi:hypothetical protein